MKLLMQRWRYKSFIHLLTLLLHPSQLKWPISSSLEVQRFKASQSAVTEWMLPDKMFVSTLLLGPFKCKKSTKLFFFYTFVYCQTLIWHVMSQKVYLAKRHVNFDNGKYQTEGDCWHCRPKPCGHKKAFLFLITMILIYSPVNVCFPLGRGRGTHY